MHAWATDENAIYLLKSLIPKKAYSRFPEWARGTAGRAAGTARVEAACGGGEAGRERGKVALSAWGAETRLPDRYGDGRKQTQAITRQTDEE
ncbi:hypothetical protein E2C01_054847 [Portunus trituberculatus]|uniref:Uncharacterized protein n=1 Tax=Portunus trituberculatus TaxID=210409 RepID=A0A5B7GKP6_PORTR|nr:hypothetical protein [Portunus trituberculatus]